MSKDTRAHLGASTAMFAALSAGPMMLRGPTVAHAPSDDGAAAAPADSGSLSVEGAMGLLSAMRKGDEGGADEARKTAAEGEGADDGAGNDEIEASATGAENASEGEDPGDGVEEAEVREPDGDPEVDAPPWWKAEHRELFAKADPELQAVIREAEAGRERAVGRLKEEAATARNTAEAEANNHRVAMQALAGWLPEAVQTFESRWSAMTEADWLAWSQEDPATYTQARAQFEAEQQHIKRAREAADNATKQDRMNALRAEAAKMPQLVPELVDPKEGPARRKALAEYIVGHGIPQDQIKDLSAAALQIALKAQKYDEGQARLAAARKRETPTPQKGNTGPSAAPQRTSHQRSIEQHSARLQKTGSINDAVALMRAQRKAG